MNKRVILIILDGLGVGELPDAGSYGDLGSNTLKNISETTKLYIPNIFSLGIGNIIKFNNVLYNTEVEGCFGKMSEKSPGKDSTTGHWEIGGLILEKPFPVFISGFNDEIINKFCSRFGFSGILGNKAASGTEIIKELGEKHIKTGLPIVYTSADSVFQIAAHEEVIPLERLYEICSITRNEIMVGEYGVARIIARPFLGSVNNFYRTTNRRDFSLKPFKRTFINYLQENNIRTTGIGKIDDLYAGEGLDNKIHTKSNKDGINEILKTMDTQKEGLIYTNLVDFDMLFGHRNDPIGYAKALEFFDDNLSSIKEKLEADDMLIITSDHGNDPTDISTDHTREYVPLLCYSKTGNKNVDLGIRDSFSDVGKTVLDYFSVEGDISGKSFLKNIFQN